MRHFKILFLIFILFSRGLFGQDDKIDSINNDALTAYKTLLLVAKQQRTVDSIAKVQLENRIKGLEQSDSIEKKTLEKQLQTLKTKDSIRLVEKKIAIEARRLKSVGYPVDGFKKDTLFLIYEKSGSFTARERALAVTDRIKKLGSRFQEPSDTLHILRNEQTVDLFNGEQIIISLSEDDALWNDTTRQKLAEKYKAIIQKAVAENQASTDFFNIAREVGFATLILLALVLIIYFTNRVFRWIEQKIRAEEGHLIKGIKFRTHQLIDAHQQVVTLVALNFLVRWAVIIALLFVVIPYVLNIFPWTRNFSDTFLGYLFNPIKKLALALYHYLPNLITIVVIVLIFRYVLLALKSLKTDVEFGRIKFKGFYREWASPTYQLVRILILAFMIVVVFEYLPKSESPIFKGVSVFLGLLFTFGSAGSLSNLTAGIILTYMRLFQIGDRVKIGEAVGDVIEKSLLVIRLRTSNNEIISIPNATVMSSQTINYSSESTEEGLIMSVVVNIGYEVPWEKVYDLLLEAADRTEEALKEPKPFALHTQLEDFYVAYEISIYTRKANSQSTVRSNLQRNIQDAFNEAGIDIMTPHYQAERNTTNTVLPAIPPDSNNKEPEQ